MADDVTREIDLPAPPDEVWSTLTEPERLAGWLADDALIELRAGGELTMRTGDGEPRTGWVEEADRPNRLCFWWRTTEDAEPTRVEIELRATEGGTRLVLTESRPLECLDARAYQLAVGSGDGTSPGPLMLARA